MDLKQNVLDNGRIITPWSGAVTMTDGVVYYGNVYRLPNRSLWVFYQNQPVSVEWRDGAYCRAEQLTSTTALHGRGRAMVGAGAVLA